MSHRNRPQASAVALQNLAASQWQLLLRINSRRSASLPGTAGFEGKAAVEARNRLRVDRTAENHPVGDGTKA